MIDDHFNWSKIYLYIVRTDNQSTLIVHVWLTFEFKNTFLGEKLQFRKIEIRIYISIDQSYAFDSGTNTSDEVHGMAMFFYFIFFLLNDWLLQAHSIQTWSFYKKNIYMYMYSKTILCI